MNATQAHTDSADAQRAGQAQLYVQFARGIEGGTFLAMREGTEVIVAPRELSIDEARTYVAALECLRRYFAQTG